MMMQSKGMLPMPSKGGDTKKGGDDMAQMMASMKSMMREMMGMMDMMENMHADGEKPAGMSDME